MIRVAKDPADPIGNLDGYGRGAREVGEKQWVFWQGC